MLRKSIKDDVGGSVFVELIVKFLLVAYVMLLAINLFDVVIKYQNVTYTAKSLAKLVELEGELTDSAQRKLIDLNESFGMDMKFKIDASYLSPGSNKIQFRNPFTIEVSYEYRLPIIDPVVAKAPIEIPIRMSADVTGMSEVYWKE